MRGWANKSVIDNVGGELILDLGVYPDHLQ